jgi:hypothetical protein
MLELGEGRRPWFDREFKNEMFRGDVVRVGVGGSGESPSVS